MQQKILTDTKVSELECKQKSRNIQCTSEDFKHNVIDEDAYKVVNNTTS